MSALTLRLVKGSPLTNTELDNNFTALNNDKLESATAASTYQTIAGMSSYLPLSGGTLTGPSVVSVNSSGDALRITQVGTGNALLVEDSANPDATPTVIDNAGNLILGSTTLASTPSTFYSTIQSHSSANQSLGIGLFNYSTGVAARGDVAFYKSLSGTNGTLSAVSTNTDIGSLNFFGAGDASTWLRAGIILAEVDTGTVSATSMPGRLVFATTPDGSATSVERVRIGSAGGVGIGTTAITGCGLRVGKAADAASYVGVGSQGTSNATVTNAYGFYSASSTTANAGVPYTITSIRHYDATQSTFNADSTVTTQYGFIANSTLTGATNNYGFYSAIAAATGAWNFYANGTASNYFAGNVGIGSTSLSNINFRVSNPITGAATAYGSFYSGAIQPTVTASAVYNQTNTNTAANGAVPYTVASVRAYSAAQGTFNADSTVTNQFGFAAESNLIGATNNYGFWSNIASGTGRWNFYAAGTADNYFAGNVGIGTASPSASLDVNGSARFGAFNSTVVPAANAGGGAYVTWNFSNGGGETVFWNQYSSASQSFNFNQITGTGTYTQLASFQPSKISLGGIPGAESLRVTPVASAVNYWNFNGSTTGNEVPMYASGSDTNIGIVLATKGTGSTFIQSNGGVTQFRVAHTASAVNYLQATGATTGNATTLSAQGGDTNIPILLFPKGTGGTYLRGQLASGVIWGANAVLITPGVAQGEQSSVSFRSTFTGTADNQPRRAAEIFAGYSGGAWGNEFLTLAVGGISGNDAMATPKAALTLTNPVSSVNYLQITGATAGSWPTFSATGSDASVGLIIAAKGTSGITSSTGGGTQFYVANTASAVNYIQATGAATGNGATLSAQGSDTNVDLRLASKGAGKVVVPGTAYSPEITLTDGVTVNWDTSLGQVAKLTLGGNRTVAAPTNLATGAFYSLNLIQDATGSRTVTWNSVFAFTGGTAPTLSTAASAVDQICFRYDGTKLREVGRSLGAA